MCHSLHTDEINHGQPKCLCTGFGRGGRPSLGAWTTYGLEVKMRIFQHMLCCRLVLLVVLVRGHGRVAVEHSPGCSFSFQWRPSALSRQSSRSIQMMDGDYLMPSWPERLRFEETEDPEIATRISQYEMAFRMQASVPDLTDLSTETAETLELYGVKPGSRHLQPTVSCPSAHRTRSTLCAAF